MEQIHSATGVLIVDDDPATLDTLQTTFSNDRYRLYYARSMREALTHLKLRKFDVVMLDVSLASPDRMESCSRIRASSAAPIIMFTNAFAEEDLIRGQDLGADDYILKPFHPMEVQARVQELLRRPTAVEARRGALAYDKGRLVIDWDRKEVRAASSISTLSVTESRVLACLIDNWGRVISQREILDQVWGAGYADQPEYVKVYIRSLRQKMQTSSPERPYIVSRRGHGYMFVAEPVEPAPPPSSKE